MRDREKDECALRKTSITYIANEANHRIFKVELLWFTIDQDDDTTSV